MWCAYYNPKNVDEDEIYKVDKKVDKNKVDKVSTCPPPWRTIDDTTHLRPPYNRITLKDAHHCSTDTTWRCETYCIKIFGSALFDDEAEACLLLLTTKKVVCHWNTLVPIVLPAVLLRHQDMKNVDKDLHITYFFAGWCGVWCMRAPAPPWIAANKHYQGRTWYWWFAGHACFRNWLRRNKRWYHREEVCKLRERDIFQPRNWSNGFIIRKLSTRSIDSHHDLLCRITIKSYRKLHK